MDILATIQTNFYLFLGLVTVLGLCIGSFLNVIIYRLPLMLEQQWRSESIEYFKLTIDTKLDEKLSLWQGRSFCPHCKTQLRIWDNIPLISYVLLRGKCAHCKHSISLQYPIVELLCALLSLAIALHFGISWQTLAGLLFTWLLIAMSAIDIKHQILPDVLTYIGIWIGLFLSLYNVFTDSQSAILGGLIGYLSLWTIANTFKLLTKKDGMGYGDFKLFAMLGVWLGWQMLILVILVASFTGAIIGIAFLITSKSSRHTPIPFGPFLALAGWLSLLYGKGLLIHYLIRY